MPDDEPDIPHEWLKRFNHKSDPRVKEAQARLEDAREARTAEREKARALENKADELLDEAKAAAVNGAGGDPDALIEEAEDLLEEAQRKERVAEMRSEAVSEATGKYESALDAARSEAYMEASDVREEIIGHVAEQAAALQDAIERLEHFEERNKHLFKSDRRAPAVTVDAPGGTFTLEQWVQETS